MPRAPSGFKGGDGPLDGRSGTWRNEPICYASRTISTERGHPSADPATRPSAGWRRGARAPHRVVAVGLLAGALAGCDSRGGSADPGAHDAGPGGVGGAAGAHGYGGASGSAGAPARCGDGVPRGDRVCFAETVEHAIADGTARSLVIADLDGDGALDGVIERNFPNGVAVARGDGAGSFRSTASVAFDPSSLGTCGVGVGDVTGDGAADVVLLQRGVADGADEVTVVEPDGDASFRTRSVALDGPSCIGAFALGDVNGDGAPDIVRRAPNVLLVHLGDGQGGFAAAVATAIDKVGGASVLLADLDGDGLPEAVGNLDARLFVARNVGGAFADVRTTVAAVHAVADVDGDGAPDFVAGDVMDRFMVMRGDGNAGFLPPLINAQAGGLLSDAAAGDVSGDGVPDLVGSTRGGVSVARQLDGLTFAEPVLVEFDAPSIELVDLNGDGHLDVVGLFGDGEVRLLVALASP